MRSASNRASEIGHPCARYHIANRLLGHLRPEWPSRIKGSFKRGKYFERYMLEEGFAELGMRYTQTQPELWDSGLDLSGHPDFVFERDGERLVVDTKSMQGGERMTEWSRIPERFRGKYRAQLEVYLRLGGYDKAALAIGDAARWGTVHFVECEPDDALWLEIQARCKLLGQLYDALRHLPAEALMAGELRAAAPGLCAGSPECTECWALPVCGCDWRGEAIPVLGEEDGELLAERAELEPYAERYAEVDGLVKARIKAVLPDGGEAVCGNWGIKVTKSARKEYVVKASTSLSVRISGGKA